MATKAVTRNPLQMAQARCLRAPLIQRIQDALVLHHPSSTSAWRQQKAHSLTAVIHAQNEVITAQMIIKGYQLKLGVCPLSFDRIMDTCKRQDGLTIEVRAHIKRVCDDVLVPALLDVTSADSGHITEELMDQHDIPKLPANVGDRYFIVTKFTKIHIETFEFV